jgi:hypothetical protein
MKPILTTCEHKRIMFNLCWDCKERFDGFNEEFIRSYLISIGMNEGQMKKILTTSDERRMRIDGSFLTDTESLKRYGDQLKEICKKQGLNYEEELNKSYGE